MVTVGPVPDPKGTSDLDPRINTLLASLPAREFGRIAPHLNPVSLARGTVLEEADEEIHDVYFPVTGVASLMAIGSEGESVDTAMIGREGMTGLAVFLGTGQMPVRTIVQVAMDGFRLPADELRAELRHGGKLLNLLQRYTQVVMVSMAQLILCNRVHRLDQRAARWLLQVDERIEEAPFDVTQEFLAEMIGTQRPSVSLAVQQFRDEGLISYSRGRIAISNRDGLLKRSCACITVLHDEERRLRDTEERYDLGRAARRSDPGAPPSLRRHARAGMDVAQARGSEHEGSQEKGVHGSSPGGAPDSARPGDGASRSQQAGRSFGGHDEETRPPDPG
jgi:CRP-like cAMP-binding protein